MNSIKLSFEDHCETVKRTLLHCYSDIVHVSKLMTQTLKAQGTVFWTGNGGSAADSQHLAAELIGRFRDDRPPLRSIALCADTAAITSIANDYSVESVFSRQIDALGRPGDLLIAISTSGLSPNIISCLQSARNSGLLTVGLLGKGGGVAKDLVDHAIIIPASNTARIQEAHILVGHCLCEMTEEALGYH